MLIYFRTVRLWFSSGWLDICTRYLDDIMLLKRGQLFTMLYNRNSYKCWSDVKSACASSIVSWFQGQQLHSRWDDTSPKVWYSSLFLLQTGKNQIAGVTIFQSTTAIFKNRSEFNTSYLRLIYVVWLLINLPSFVQDRSILFAVRADRRQTNQVRIRWIRTSLGQI